MLGRWHTSDFLRSFFLNSNESVFKNGPSIYLLITKLLSSLLLMHQKQDFYALKNLIDPTECKIPAAKIFNGFSYFLGWWLCCCYWDNIIKSNVVVYKSSEFYEFLGFSEKSRFHFLVVHYLFTFRDDGPFKERKIKSDQIIYQD